MLLSKGEKEGHGYYQFLTEGTNVCARCSALDGKKIKISDAKAGENLPPLHPNCRCEIVVLEGDYKHETSLPRAKPAKRDGKRDRKRPTKTPQTTTTTAKPTSNMVLGECEMDCNCIYHKGTHNGLDFLRDWSRGDSNDPIYASISGIVTIEKSGAVNNPHDSSDPGNTIRITSLDGRIYTRYLHLNEIHVENGDKINAGTQIGTMGNTGYSFGMHLHFEVWVDGIAMNPMEYFNW